MLKVMAEVKMTWLDYIKGRFHGVVFYNRKGRTYLRKAPGEYKPATVWQKRQRNRLREVSVFYSIIRQTCLKQIWAKAAEGMSMSGMNLFVKMNIGAFSGIDQWRDICLRKQEFGIFGQTGYRIYRRGHQGDGVLGCQRVPK